MIALLFHSLVPEKGGLKSTWGGRNQCFKEMAQLRGPGVSGSSQLPPAPHPPLPLILCPLALTWEPGLPTEDVRREAEELHAIDDKGEGGQVLDVVTVHRKLQRRQWPGRLISPLRGPAIPITRQPPGVLLEILNLLLDQSCNTDTCNYLQGLAYRTSKCKLLYRGWVVGGPESSFLKTCLS